MSKVILSRDVLSGHVLYVHFFSSRRQQCDIHIHGKMLLKTECRKPFTARQITAENLLVFLSRNHLCDLQKPPTIDWKWKNGTPLLICFKCNETLIPAIFITRMPFRYMIIISLFLKLVCNILICRCLLHRQSIFIGQKQCVMIILMSKNNVKKDGVNEQNSV